jgi:hypothetical protein
VSSFVRASVCVSPLTSSSLLYQPAALTCVPLYICCTDLIHTPTFHRTRGSLIYLLIYSPTSYLFIHCHRNNLGSHAVPTITLQPAPNAAGGGSGGGGSSSSSSSLQADVGIECSQPSDQEALVADAAATLATVASATGSGITGPGGMRRRDQGASMPTRGRTSFFRHVLLTFMSYIHNGLI